MRKIALAAALVLATALSAGAQGVHLLPGQTLSIEFNGVGDCRSSEPTYAGGSVGVTFGNDILAPGEELFLEMFEDGVTELSVASRLHNPAAPVVNVSLGSPGSWLDYQGVIRVSMLSGSVDVRYAHFWVRPDPFTYCDTVVLVPEPPAGILSAVAGILLVAVAAYRHTRR